MLKKINNLSKQNFFLILLFSLLNISIFLNNTLFYIILFCLFYFKNFYANFEIKNNFERYLLYFTSILFYTKKFWEHFLREDFLFWDNQYLFIFFRCNKGLTDNFVFLSKVVKDCSNDLGFGLLPKFISLNIDPWLASKVIFISTVFFIFTIVSKIESKFLYLIFLFLLSPSFRFLLFSLNPDIIFLIGFISLIYFKDFNLNTTSFIIITVFTQIKIFPIAILIGYLFFIISIKNSRLIYKPAIFLFLNLVLVIYDIFYGINYETSPYINTIFGIPYVYAPIYSFGIIADYFTFIEVQLTENLRNLYFILILLIIFIFFAIILIKKINSLSFSSITILEKKVFISFLPMIYFISLFGNYGYKLPFNFILIFMVFQYFDKYLRYLFIVFIFFNPLFYLLNFEYAHQLFSPSILYSLSFAISRISFYLVNLTYLLIFFKIVKIKN